MAERMIYTVSVDDKGTIHQRCKIQSRAEALELIKQLGAGITKISDDFIKDVKSKGQ